MKTPLHLRRRMATRGFLALAGFLLASAGAAVAYFLIGILYGGGNYALASAASLNAPGSPTAVEASANSVNIGWTNGSPQLPGTTYQVVLNPGGSQTVVCASPAANPCTVGSLTAGTTYNYGVEAVLGSWQSTGASVSYTALGVTTSSLPGGTVGDSTYSKTLAAAGGSGTYSSWALGSGSNPLPGGLSLNPSTGVVSGTPNTAGTFSGITFRVTDSKGVSATSGSLSITIAQSSTTTSISLSPTSVTYGNEASGETITATVTSGTSGTPSGGTVTVKAGATTVCSASITAGSGTCSPSSQTLLGAAGSPYSLTGTYGGDSNYAASGASTAKSLAVNKDSTTTSVSEAPTSVVYGNEASVTFTPVVTTHSGEALGSGDTITVSVNSGAAACTVTIGTNTTCAIANAALAVGGPYSVGAIYNGNGNLSTSSGTASSGLTVTQASTATSQTLSATTVTYGAEQTITYTVGVTSQFSGTPTGTVTVKAGSTTLCSVGLPSTTCSSSATALAVPGSSSITAVYGGDTNFMTSTSTTKSLTVSQDTTSATVSDTPTTVTYGAENASVFTVAVTTGNHEQLPGTESVTVHVGTASCSASVAPAGNGGSGTCSLGTTDLSVQASAYTATATYSGDTDLAASSLATAATGLTVNKDSTVLTYKVNSSSSGSSTYGNEANVSGGLNFTFAVVGGNGEALSVPASDSVAVTQSSTGICSNTLSSGSCLPSLGTVLDVGTYTNSVTGALTLGGVDAINFTAASAQSVTVTISQATTSVGVALITPASGTPVTGQSVTFTATVSPQFSGTPSGTVTFTVKAPGSGGTQVNCSGGNTQTLSGATASCTLPAASVLATNTPYNVAVSYGGDSNFTGSAGSLSQTVNKASTTIAVGSSANPSISGSAVTFTASVAAGSPGSGTPTGTVTFTVKDKNNAIVNCTTTNSPTLSSGQASCLTSSALSSTNSPYNVSVSYGGDNNYSTSTGSLSGGQTVNPAASISVTCTGGPSVCNNPTTMKKNNTVVFTVAGSAFTPNATGLTVTVTGGTQGSVSNFTNNTTDASGNLNSSAQFSVTEPNSTGTTVVTVSDGAHSASATITVG